MLDMQVVDELFDIRTVLGELEARIRAGSMSRRQLLETAKSTRPLLERLHEVVEEHVRGHESQTVQIALARARIQSAQTHEIWVSDRAQWASEGAIRRQLLWAAIAGQTAVELLTAPRHPGDIARA